MKPFLNRNQIKYIVTAAMLIDHIAWLFVSPYSEKAFWMHFIGRLAGPTMAVFITEGYINTHDVNKYTGRLALFALVSWPCFSLMEYNKIGFHFGVIFTLLLALIAVRICDTELSWTIKAASVVLLCVLSTFGDWSVFGVLFSVNAYIFYEKKTTRWIIHAAISMAVVIYYGFTEGGAGFQLGTLLVVPMFLFLYNGEGGSKKPFHKWFFYVFYPLHMLVLWFIKYRL